MIEGPEAETAASALYFLPMQYKNCAVRMKICPSEIAGELSV